MPERLNFGRLEFIYKAREFVHIMSTKIRESVTPENILKVTAIISAGVLGEVAIFHGNTQINHPSVLIPAASAYLACTLVWAIETRRNNGLC